MLAVVEEEVTHDAPKVVDEIGVIEVHAPTVGRGRETAEKEHAAVGRQEGRKGVRLDGPFVLSCECIGRSGGRCGGRGWGRGGHGGGGAKGVKSRARSGGNGLTTRGGRGIGARGARILRGGRCSSWRAPSGVQSTGL